MNLQIDNNLIIDVKKILASEIGTSKTDTFDEDIKTLDEYQLTKNISGIIKLTNLDDKLIAEIVVSTEILQKCDKCAEDFNQKVNLDYKQIFSINPSEDEFKIINNSTIDIWPSIRQEIIVSLPIRIICDKNCKGIKVKE